MEEPERLRRHRLPTPARRRSTSTASASPTGARRSRDSASGGPSGRGLCRLVREVLGRAIVPDPKDVSRGRYILLIFICAIFLLGTFVALSFVPPAFTEPAPDFKSLGSIETLIATTDEETNNNPRLFEWDNRIFIHARYSQTSAVVYYTLWFPSKFAGRKFALLLGGSAVMRNAHAGIQVGPLDH
jgi:hypothetical protein